MEEHKWSKSLKCHVAALFFCLNTKIPLEMQLDLFYMKTITGQVLSGSGSSDEK